MRRRTLTWLVFIAVVVVGVLLFWRPRGHKTPVEAIKAASVASGQTSPASRPPGEKTQPASSVPLVAAGAAARTNPVAAGSIARPTSWLKYRLSNTTRSVGELLGDDQAVLLENALIDTTRPLNLEIPQNLKAQGDPGSYIVQAKGAVDNAFRAELKEAGATIVSYIPNNAYLVRVSQSGAQAMNARPDTQSVLPYEPYYKLKSVLLRMAVEQQPLPTDAMLNLVVFADARQATLDALQKMGTPVVAQGNSPFGPVLTVQPGSDSLATLAGLSGVQSVEMASTRKPSVDLSRARVGVAADSVTPDNYLGLKGKNVVVNVNDTGVDATHPDLAGRVDYDVPASGTDTNGHGTQVAGIIAGNGTESTTVTNAAGSIMPGKDGQFRGMAPEATIYSIAKDGRSDFYLQENPAQTKALISNNAWNYSGSDYDINAASYDAAVRDALPSTNGSQPLVIVFPAGNAGNGSDDGTGVTPGTVQSPGTAKNVITVGAIEQPRGITNETQIVKDGSTNTFHPWAGMTDSDSEVASFSSRGNVGIDVEGDFGRFKPDLVAPGTFVVSTRSAQWDQAAYYNPTNYHYNSFLDTVDPGAVNPYLIFLPYNTVEMQIGAQAIHPKVNLPIYINQEAPPVPGDIPAGTNQVEILNPSPVETFWNYGIGNPTNQTVDCQVTTRFATTNDNGNYLEVLSNLNQFIGTPSPDGGPYYRYETGTSMAAADVSGVLALMEDYFTNTLHLRPSPALMKAMLINGARTVNAMYDLEVKKTLNNQGWGLVNLTNSIPSGLPTNAAPQDILNAFATGPSPMLVYDQEATNALATGDSRTLFFKVSTNANDLPLRITLVWTDPPGNPAAGVKLVNDLDLVVTNLDNPTNPPIYFGNDFPAGSQFTFSWDTNSAPNVDKVNNVENVFLQNPVGTNYSVTVFGRRVNVNAVNAEPNNLTNDNVAQDYALVISSGDGSVSDALQVTNYQAIVPASTPDINALTNQFASTTNGPNPVSGTLLLGQHVGANPPLMSAGSVALGTGTEWGTNGLITLGLTNQWHFYILTNEFSYTNAAFGTFLPPTLSMARMGLTNVLNPDEATRPEADIDMYVSTNAALLDLDPTAIAQADKSVTRGGTELVTYTNAEPEAVYYIGIHSEDQKAAEYGFYGIFSQNPFMNNNGDVIWFPLPAAIPDGSPTHPGGVQLIGIVPRNLTVRRVILRDQIIHQEPGDLFGILNHDQISVVLNNHSCVTDPATGSCYTNYTYVYEDNGENNVPNSQHTDGPGSLTEYMGEPGQGAWFLTEIDNALGGTGEVYTVQMHLDSQDDLATGQTLDIAAFSFAYAAVDVPPEATNMTISVEQKSDPPLPLVLYVRRGDLPTLTDYDYSKLIIPPGDSLSIGLNDFPPLTPGRWYIGVYNPNSVGQQALVTVKLDLDVNGVKPVLFTSVGPTPIADDAVSYSSIEITNRNTTIARAEVGVVIDHPRISDLSLTLISPSGKRILLMENRGGDSPDGAGSSGVSVVNTAFQDGFEAGNQGTYYAPSNFSTGWHIDAGDVDLLINGFDGSTADTGTHFIDINGFNPGTISTNFATIPGAKYRLSFAYARNPNGLNGPTPQVAINVSGSNILTVTATQNDNSWPNLDWQHTSTVFTATSPMTELQVQGLTQTSYGVLLDSFRVDQLSDHFTYLVFSDNKNKTQIPIKFEATPFTGAAVSNFNISGFETNGAGNYAAPATVGGWSVISNQVSVVTDPLIAQSGTNFLALADGVLRRALPTQPSRRYVLRFDYRGPGIVGMWRGESNAFDSVDMHNGIAQDVTYTNGVVGSAFVFNPASGTPRVSVPDEPAFALTNELSMEGWIRPTGTGGTIFWRGDNRPGYDPYYMQMTGSNLEFYIENYTNIAVGLQSPSPLASNQWWHIAGVFDGNSGLMKLYVNGTRVAQTFTTLRPFGDLIADDDPALGIGNVGEHTFSYPFSGDIDEISLYSRALSDSELKAIYDAGSAGKFDSTTAGVTIPESLAEAELSLDGTNNVIFGDNNRWSSAAYSFTATQSGTPVQLRGLEPGMLVDNFTLTDMSGDLYTLPEEALKDLIGDDPLGTWTLEIQDNRAGATNPPPVLASWQLRLVLVTNTPPVTPLYDSIAVTNTLAPCDSAYYYVDVPPWVSYVTNTLLYATAPVNLWFNQDRVPLLGAGLGDKTLLANTTGGYFTLSTNSDPPLLAGKRYYLAVQNPCANATNVNFAIRVDFGTDFIQLTNGIPYSSTNSGGTNINDYYVYSVTTNAARAQFEIDYPSGDMTLMARKGSPPDPGYDYISTNSGLNDELIVVLTNSTPVALTPGRWYLAAINESGGPVSYQIMATEWPVTGRPFSITNFVAGSNSFCITWESLPGVHYYIQGTPALGSTNWYTVTRTITATNDSTEYCIPLPSPFSFFRVVEGLSLIDVPQPPPLLDVNTTTNGFLLQWLGSVTAQYMVQWSPLLPPPPSGWNTFTNVITSANGEFSFLDDGTQSGGLGGTRLYRVIQVP